MQSAKQAPLATPAAQVHANTDVKYLNTGLAPSQKAQVAESFSHAAKNYDRFARLQQDVVKSLCQLLIQPKGEDCSNGVSQTQHKRLLDLGCGTADVYQHLSEYIDYTGLDISSGMLAQAEQKYPGQLNLVLGDAEALPFPDCHFDIISSSLAVQWCDLNKVLKEAYRVLKPGGQCVFSTLLEGTLAELNTAWHAIDEKAHVNHFLSQASLERYISGEAMAIHTEKQNKEVQSVDEQVQSWSRCESVYDELELAYPSALAVMRELKAIGANKIVQAESKPNEDNHKDNTKGKDKASQSRSVLTKGTLARLEAAYPKTIAKTDGNEISYATWKVAYISLKK